MHGQFSIKFLNNHLLTWTRHIAHTQTTTLVQARARARTVSRVLRAALPEQGQRLLNSLQPRFRSSLTRFLPTTTLFPQHTRIHVRRDKVHARCTSAREIQRPHATHLFASLALPHATFVYLLPRIPPPPPHPPHPPRSGLLRMPLYMIPSTVTMLVRGRAWVCVGVRGCFCVPFFTVSHAWCA